MPDYDEVIPNISSRWPATELLPAMLELARTTMDREEDSCFSVCGAELPYAMLFSFERRVSLRESRAGNELGFTVRPRRRTSAKTQHFLRWIKALEHAL